MSAASQLSFRASLAAACRNKKLWCLCATAFFLLALATWGWLHIPDARWWQLAATALFGLLILFSAFVLYAIAILYFHWTRTSPEPCGARFLEYKFLRLVPAGGAAIVLHLACTWLLVRAAAWPERWGWAEWLSSSLTRAIQKPIAPDLFTWLAGAWAWKLAWLLFAVLWLPLACGLVVDGAGGAALRRAARAWSSIRYWLKSLVLFAAGFWLPWQIANWVPQLASSTAVETVSLVVRWGVAYCVAMTAWLALVALAESAGD